MVYTVADLARTLQSVPETDYVRVAAEWLSHGEVSEVPPQKSSEPVINALVAATVAHLARTRGEEVPAWTRDRDRALEPFWHPGSDRFFAYALVHAPAEFAARGVLVEEGSLVSV